MSLKLHVTCVAIFSALFLQITPASAGRLTETWIQTGSPSVTQMQQWTELQLSRGTPEITIRILLESTPSSSIAELARVPGVKKLQVSSPSYPTSDQIEKYLPLAKMGAEFVSLSGAFPSEAQVDALNAIGFSRVVLTLSRYPVDADVTQLLRLRMKTALTFNSNRYPEFLEKFALAKLPLDLPLQITVDTWPRYVQMDVWNMIPQTEKRLRILRTMLSTGGLPYTLNLKNVAEIIFVSDGDVLNQQWDQLAGFPLRWSVQGAVPSARALKLFSDSGHTGLARKLVIDRDGDLSAAERARLDQASGLEIEWIHEAP